MPFTPVYSSPFIQYSPSTPNGEFDVPAGNTAVVRQISVVQDVGGYDAYVAIFDSLTGPGIVIWQQIGIGAGNSVAQEGRWVVPGGGKITIFLSAVGDATYFYVGGYLLQNVLD